ncbi:FAD-dependent monooxygenase [Sphingomonas sp. HITSZ_GF]|uniref:FAD-dependent oxidoreductase n=1 Tax=Sphingomonas sp. HITSZ_GF TaxID=3037247 RepID=UPI00240D4D59|nr:FAD-dependent monooxygenase [Sphingomonas sp. HITSZ_GF]MDG2532156.1 FAD-dependent monooxygenase [Sphingomonas sp. HITSZ_GF]
MTTTQTGVIVVGAGPVGLTAAYLLGHYDIPFLLLAAEPVLATDLRASTFHPPTLDMLDEHGLAEPLIAQGLVSPTWQIRLHRTGERAKFDLGVIAGDTRHPFRLQCEQSRLCALLLDRIRAAGKGELMLGWQVDSVVQDERGAVVTARPVGQPDAEPQTFSARFVIGADGSRSVVREAAGIGFEGKTYPETTVLATTTFPFEEHLKGLSNVNYVWKDGGTFSLLRLRHLWRCSLYPDGDETLQDALQPESIARKLQEITPGAGDHPVMETRAYRIHMRIADTYRNGRLLLAGDAAHVNSPSGGMGMNGGVHDAFELISTLAEVWNGAPDLLLDRYTRRRRPIAEQEVLAQADRNRARMQERDDAKRLEMLRALQKTAADPEAAREHLLRSSMIAGLRRAAAIA